VLLQKAVNSEDCTHHRREAARSGTQMKFDVLSAIRFVAEACKFITPTIIKNRCVKHGFSFSSNYDSAVQLDEEEEDDWPSLQSL
jgi:hypothetical protein